MFHKKQAKDKKEYKDEEDTKWIPDYKHKECMLCHKQFSIINRRHHCRNCGRLTCNDCSKKKWRIDDKYERICNLCFQSMKSQSHSQSDELTSNQRNNISYNPQLQMLSEPTLITWLATFEKSWIRSRYPKKYEKYKKQLLKQQLRHRETSTKPSNATIKSKLTPKRLEKRMTMNASGGSARYQRVQKTKYVAASALKHSASAPFPAVTMKPKKCNPLIVVQVGLLYVNIMEAQGLPNCDMFSQPDGYCIYYVTNNDPCFGETTRYSTKVQHNTYEPEWNEDETIVITNTTGKLCIELWDYDMPPESDDYLGRVEMNISDLFLHFACEQARYSIIDDWFEVQLAPQWQTHNKDKKSHHDTPVMAKKRSMLNTESMDKTVYRNPHSAELLRQKYLSTSGVLQSADEGEDEAPIYRRLTLPLLSLQDTLMDADAVKKKCFIHLQIKLRATRWGHFISMFDPLLPPPPKQEPFDMDRFYAELNVLLSYVVYPVMDSSRVVMDTVFWIKYMWASLYVLLYGYCVFHPWFAVFWMQFRLLMFVSHSYVKQTALAEDGIGNQEIVLPAALHALCIVFGIIPTVLKAVCTKNKELLMAREEEEGEDTCSSEGDEEVKVDAHPDEEQDITMSGFTRMIGNNVIRVSGLKDNLGWYQELLVWMNQMIRYSIELLTWKYVQITSGIVIGLSVSCLLLIVFRDTTLHQYQLLLVGTAVLTYFSKPVQFVQWLLLGVTRWYNTYYAPYTKFKTELNNDSTQSESVEEDMNRKGIKGYLYGMMERLRSVCGLAMDLLFGLIIFMKAMTEDSKKKNAFHERSKTDPTGTIFKPPPPLKRGKRMGNARRIESKSIMNRFGGMFKSVPLEGGSIEQSQNKRKPKKKMRKAKTMKKQPTLLRKRTLKRIENKADRKIDSMMTKLHQAKSAHSVF